MLFDRLSAPEQQRLKSLRNDPELYGILRPRNDPQLTWKSVSKESALLLLTLQSAAPLPEYASAALGAQCDSVIGQMILDGILEVEVEGRMLSGPEAFEPVFGSSKLESETTLGALSLRAVEYAAGLDVTEALALSYRLYAYNRIPASRRWLALLSDDVKMSGHLGIDDPAVARTLAASWERSPGGDSWLVWQSRRAPFNRATTTYKLYVSPAGSELRPAFAATVNTLSQSASFQWKIGRNVFGLLRPDKIVAYFEEFADLQETAAQLGAALQGCPAHGVPFTAELTGRGLLSWGIDPPLAGDAVPWLERESWRLRICNLLGTALAMAKASNQAAAASARFALQRLKLDGIDTNTWAPVAC